MDIAKSIRVAIAREGKTQTWLAEQLKTNRATVNTYCRGKAKPSHRRVEVMSEIFGMTVSEFIALGEK
jgi:ribosome-binding protein aMBF1 (putative translation factor)